MAAMFSNMAAVAQGNPGATFGRLLSKATSIDPEKCSFLRIFSGKA
jgi:hypothetical protein